MTKKEIIEKITPLFIEQLEHMTITYKVIGVSGEFAVKHGLGHYDESPMWLQYQGANEDSTAVVFKCSMSRNGFEIPMSEEEIDALCFSGGTSHLYDYFKKVKYEYLRDNHPTVFNEQSYQLPRINSFLELYIDKLTNQ
jgi:hypothetical protein